MNSRKLFHQAFGSVLVVLLLAGCGGTLAKPTATPMPLTDDEFVEVAQEVCSVLNTEINTADKAQVYRQAADRLSEIEITEQSAPQGFLLRSSLVELANAYDAFDAALTEALTKANIDEQFRVLTTMDGQVFLVVPAKSRLEQLDIEPDLVLKLIEIESIVQETAISLGLDDCAAQQ